MTMVVQVTVDHDVIKHWAERRGARPARPLEEGRPWQLRLDAGPPDAGVKEIGWDEFLAEFDRANLAFLYRDTGPNGELDDLHEFISQAAVPELTVSARSTIAEKII